MFGVRHGDGVRGTAEITTSACAIGPSSVMVTSMRASQPGGVIACSRASAPPVSFMVGRPDGRLTTPMSRQNTPARRPGAERLGAGLLGRETLGIGLAPPGAAFGFGALGRGEDASEKTLAVALDGTLDAADIDEIGTDTENHARPRSMPARMVFTAAARPHGDRLSDQEMADIELDDLGQRRDRLRRLEIEAMAGMDFEAEPARKLRPVADALPFRLRRRCSLVGKRVAPGAGVELDHRRADRDRCLDLTRLGGDEQRYADAGRPQPGDDRRQRGVLAGDIETAFGRAFFAPLGHQTGGVRRGRERDRDHLLGRRHFQIERFRDLRLEARDVVVADVPAVLAQVRGDAVGAGFDRELRRAHRIRMPSAARVADGGDVIDVDAEAKMGEAPA